MAKNLSLKKNLNFRNLLENNMNFKNKKVSKIRVIIFFFVTALLLFTGCASKTVSIKEPTEDTAESFVSKLITDISTTEDSESSMVWIRGNELLTYTSVKQPSPIGVLLYFPETALDDIESIYTPASDIVSSIKASELTDKGHTTRIEILLKKDNPYEVTREDTGIKISFEKMFTIVESTVQELVKEEKSAEKILLPASILDSVNVASLENGLEITIKADGTIKDYKSFTVESPARIVFDINNVKSPFEKEQLVQVNSRWVKRVRQFGYPDRLRVVLDTKPEFLTAYSASPAESGLLIHVGKETEQAVQSEQGELRAEATAQHNSGSNVNNSKPAWINRIDFSSEDDGKSIIIIGTTTPVTYDIKKINDKKLLLNINNTKLPDYRQRPLITTRFQSAVDRITPFQTPAMKDSSLVAIELREPVPYFVEQTDNLIQIHFEASSILPKPLDEAQLSDWKKVMAQAVAKTEAEEMKPSEEEILEAPYEKFTGEKIALNFFDTDIKNVFRILMDVSGKNFVIDKGVSGKVTLNLQKPVPWDQVLDLILRMNRLGMIHEGDIVRIVTLKTLKAEEKARKAQKVEDKKMIAEEKALEPLITEYMPVNYADAAADVLPHIVLTPGRGSVTVDVRNNQIVITDVAEMIDQAKETVKQIDQVTPQVIIEARIVEATNTFSRDLGTEWAVKGGPIDSDWLNGNLNFDMSADNPPAADPLGQIGFNFTSLASSSIELLDLRLKASESHGLLKIISAPKILTLDNTPASIKQGLAYPYNKLDADGNTTTTFKDIALELEVTPHITPDNRVSMKISVKNNEIGALINNQISFSTKEANTELLVDDGDTIIIGGIRKTRNNEGESGIPGLMKIPLLGWLFKSNLKADNMEELLIFITPRIVKLEQQTVEG